MISTPSLIAVAGIIIFLSGVAFGAFILLIISMRRTARVPLSEVHEKRAGAISRSVLVGARSGGRGVER
jgi:hypothetical protein